MVAAPSSSSSRRRASDLPVAMLPVKPMMNLWGQTALMVAGSSRRRAKQLEHSQPTPDQSGDGGKNCLIMVLADMSAEPHPYAQG